MEVHEFIAQFISEYGTTILYAVLSVAATAIGAWVGQLYKEKVNDETKRKVVKTCCAAVEQLYYDLSGPEKFSKACEAIEAMLAEKSIAITALEMEMLIEEVCLDFAHSAKNEIEKVDEVVVNGFMTTSAVDAEDPQEESEDDNLEY